MKKHLQKLLLLAALLLPWATQAQSYTLGDYGYMTGVDASKWVDMTGSTQILTPANSDGMASAVQNIGFTFPFASTTYTQYSVNTDGNMRLGATATGTTYYTTPFNSTNANQNNPKINAFGCDGYGNSGTNYVKSKLHVTLDGDTMLVVEFCTGTYNSTTRSYLYKWQIHLFTNGDIEIVFPGASELPLMAPAVVHQCGLCASSTDGWVISSATNTVEHFTSGSTVTNDANTWFDANRYYAFIHPSSITCPSPTGVTVSDVTADSATISWTAGGSELEWEVIVDSMSTVVSTNTYRVGDLTSNTAYGAFVRAICGYGDTSYLGTRAFRTTCSPISVLPYSEDFESYGSGSTYPISPCWAKGIVNSGSSTQSTQYPYPTSTAITGTRSLYFYAGHTSAYHYYNWAVLPPIDNTMLNMSDLMLTFKMKRGTSSSSATTTYTSRLIIGVTTDYTTTAGFVPVDTIDFSSATVGSVHDVEVTFENYLGTGRYIMFYAPAPANATSSNYNNFYIDDVVLRNSPTCFWPTSVTLTSVTSDGADLVWTPDARTSSPSSWSVEYGVHGFTPGTGNTVTVYDTTVSLYSLQPNTQYDVYVSADCGGDVSDPTLFTFRTECVLLDSLPYSYGFEDLSTGTTTVEPFIPCWHHLNNGTQYFGYPYPSSSNCHTGARSLYWYAATTAATYGDYQVAVLPGVDTDIYPINTLQLDFWARPSSTSYSPVFQVGVMTDPTDNSTFQLVQTVNVQNVTNYQLFEVPLSSFTGYGQYVAVRAVRPTSLWYAYTDDFTLKELPSCPHVESVAATYVTLDSIEIAWTPVGTESAWVVAIGADTNYAYDTTYVFEMLTANTPYVIGVAPLCDDGNVGDFVNINVRTACDYLTTLPYTENFDGVTGSTATAPTENNLPPCWDYFNHGTRTNYMYCPYVYSSTTYSHSGSNCVRFYTYTASGDSTQYLILPITDPYQYPVSSLMVSFWLRGYNTTTSYHADVVVGVMTDASDESTFVPVATFSNSTTSYTYHEAYFANYTGEHGRIALKFPKPTASSNYEYGYVDDVTISEIPSCPTVMSHHVTATAGAAHITWDYDHNFGGTPDSYEVAYSYAADSLVGATTIYATDLFVTLTGLDADTDYMVAITPVCSGVADIPHTFTFATLTLPCVDWDTTGGAAAGPADTIVVGTPGTSTSAVMPVNNSYNYSYCQHLILSTLLPSTPTTISGIGFDYASTTAMTHATNCSIYLANTTRADMMATDSSFVPYSQLTLVYTGALNCTTTGWNYFQFNQGSFTYDGTHNLVVAIVNNSGSSDGSSCTFRYETLPSSSSAAMTHRVYNNNTPYGPTQMDAARAGQSYWRSNMRLTTGGGGDCIAWATCMAPAVEIDQDTTGDFVLSWIPGYQETSWDVDYRVAGGSWTNVVSGTTIREYTFLESSLQANTDYEFRVSANCTDSNLSTTVSYRTPCSSISIPFSENFESQSTTTSTSTTFIPCWHHLNNGTSYMGYPILSATTSYNHTAGGTKGLYWYATTTTGTYGDYYAIVLPPVNPTTDPVNTLQLTFWAKPTSASYAPVFQVGVMTDPSDISTFQTVATINVDHTTTDWQPYETVLSSYSGNGRYVTIRANRPSSAWYACMDDITLEHAPSCARVTGVGVRDITQTDATVYWDTTSAYEYEVQYGPANFTLGSGTTVANIVDDSVVLTGLTTNTPYDVYVRGICWDDTANWSFVYQFRTACTQIDTLPFFEDFEAQATTTSSSPVFIPCWGHLNNGTSYPGYPYLANSTTYNHTTGGSKGLYWSLSTTTGTYGDYEVIVLPQVNTTNNPINTLQLTFWAKPSSTSYAPVFQVGVMTDPTNLSSFQTVTTINVDHTTTNWLPYEAVLSSYTGTGSYVAIRANRPSSAWYAYMDDIALEHSPACSRVTGVGARDITQTDATIYWDSTNAYEYEVQYGPVGFSMGSGTMVTGIYDDTVAITGLAANTVYDVYVRGICMNDTANWSFAYQFRTACGLIDTLPFFEDFEAQATTTSSSTTFIPCWGHLNNGTSYPGYPYLANSTTYNHTPGGSKGFYWYAATTTGTYGDYYYIILPQIDTNALPMNTLQLSFWARSSSTSYYPIFHVGVMSNPNLHSSFQPVDTIELGNSAAWAEHVVGFGGFQGNGSYVAIRALRPASIWYAYMDDIRLEALPACPRVEDLHASYTALDSITITWSDTSNNSAWYVEYDTVNFTPGSHTPIYVTDTFYTMTGLDSGTTYHIYVYPDCGGSVNERYLTTSTLAASPATVPYTCNFEAAGVNGWDLFTEGQTNHWMVGNATGNPGRSLYVTNNGSDNSYSTGSISYSYATRVFRINTPGEYSYSFDWKCQGEGNYDFIRVFFVNAAVNVEAGVLPFGTSSYNFGQTVAPAGWIDLAGRTSTPYALNQQNTWQTRTGTMTLTTPGNYKMIIAWSNDGSGGSTPPGAIDNVSLTLNNCPAPISIVAPTINTNSMVIDWTDVNSTISNWEVRYAPTGSTSYTTLNVTSHPVTITGLTSLTPYTFYVRSICSATDTGNWSSGVELTTAMCDNARIVSTATTTSTVVNSYYTPVNNYYHYSLTETIIDSAEIGGPMDIEYLAYYYNYTTAVTQKTNCTVYLQPTNKTVFSGTGDIVHLSPDAVRVYVGSFNVSQGWNYFALDTTYHYDGTGNLMVIVDDNSDAYPGSAYVYRTQTCTGYKTIVYYSDSYNPDPATVSSSYSGTKTYYQVRADMQLLSCAAPTCAAPTIVSNTGDYQSRTIVWGGTGSAYEVAIKPVSATVWPAETPVTTNTYTFTGLQPATAYQARVRQDCTADSLGYSNWVEVPFMTDSLPCVAPDTLAVLGTTNSTATFGWVPVGNETAWDIKVWHAGTNFDSIYTVTANPATVGGFTAGVTYNAAIRALCGDSANIEGEWGDTVQFTAAICGDVTGLSIDSVTHNSVSLSWNAVTSAQGYRVAYIAGQYRDTITTVATNHTFYGLPSDLLCTLYVQTVCGTGWYSENWAVDTVTTLEEPDSTFTITAVPNNPAFGSVTGSGNYVAGSTVTLTATANTGYHFVSWNDLNTTNPRTITVTGDATYTANFAINTYTVTVSSANPTMGSTTGGGTYNHNDTANLVATANPGHHFVAWNDGDTHATRQVVITSDSSFSASFAANQYTITVTPNDPAMGSVTGGGTYSYGDTATLVATANTGYGFRGWSDGNTSNPRSLLVTGNITLQANFSDDTTAITEYTVTLTVNDPAMGSLSTYGGQYAEGTNLTVTATANAGYHFVNWSDDNTDNPRTFTVNSDITMQANFAQDVDSTAVLTVSVNDAAMGYVTINGNTTSTYRGRLGDQVSLAAVANDGYLFVSWSDGETSATRTYTLMENTAELTATFRQGEGIADVTTASCTLYPNPAKGATTVSVTGISGKVRIAVLDLSGREVMSETVECSADCEKTLDIEGLAEGAYFVRITSEAAAPMVKKLIVR